MKTLMVLLSFVSAGTFTSSTSYAYVASCCTGFSPSCPCQKCANGDIKDCTILGTANCCIREGGKAKVQTIGTKAIPGVSS